MFIINSYRLIIAAQSTTGVSNTNQRHSSQIWNSKFNNFHKRFGVRWERINFCIHS